MTEFLGIPMTAIMVILIALLAVSLASVGLVWARNRIIFDIGLRNIPRRRAQSALIVLGLMLSTAIIAAAFSIGDTVSYSITNDTYDKLGQVDEIVEVRSNRGVQSLTEEQILPAGVVRQDATDTLVAAFNGDDRVDGVLTGLRFPAPVRNSDSEVVEPQVVIMGLDKRSLAGFEQDIVTDIGATFNLAQLAFDQALVNESAREALDVQVGDRLEVFIQRAPRTLTVAGFVQDRYLTGWTLDEPNGILVGLDTAQLLLQTDGAGFVAISNRGGARVSAGLSDEVQAAARAALTQSLRQHAYEVETIKQDRLDRAREIGSDMTAIFVVLGLFSIAAGLLLVFLTLVMLATERRPEMGMSRAVGMSRLHLVESFMAEGMAYSVTAAAAGALLGVAVSIAMTRAMAYIFNRFDVAMTFHVTPRSLIVAYCLGVVLTFVTVVIAAWRVSRLSIVAAIREVNEPPPRATGAASALAGALMLVAGVSLLVYGIADEAAWAFGGGASLVLIGGAFVARALGQRERPVFTVTSAAVIVLWVLVAGDDLSAITGELDAGLATFLVGGVLMVAAATLILVYNADVLLSGVRGLGAVSARAMPAVRTSMAYPLANKFRTGMTIAMMSLVVFALVMISTLNLNFRKLFLSEDSRGGWDAYVFALPINALDPDDKGNPLGPLGESLDRAFYDTSKIEAVAEILVSNPRATKITQVGADGQPVDEGHAFRVLGADDVFLQENQIGLQARAEGYATDREAWEAVRADPNNAIIDGSVVPGINYANVTEGRFTLDGYESGTETFTPFPLFIQNTSTGINRAVRVVGIMNRGPSETYAGLWLNRDAADNAFPALFTRYFIRLAPGVDAEAEADAIEAALAQYGVSAFSVEEEVEESQALSSSFFYLVQGFMALGLGVGLAALGVIAFRTVVERRQQIGLMRAIGFTRGSIALTFLLESSFIALLGILNGIWLALLLANRLLSSEQFSTAGFTTFYVPWLQIVLMAVAVFLAAVLTTLVPSRQASGIPPADALRYE